MALLLRPRCLALVLLLLLCALALNSVASIGGWVCPTRHKVTLRARELKWWCGAADDEASIAKKIEAAFSENMTCEDLPLFADFSTYAASLPVREGDFQRGPMLLLRLHEVPFYAAERDIDRTVAVLTRRDASKRGQVNYLAAPSGSGKSASVLPIFLRSCELGLGFTHYIHMPFAKNGGRYHLPPATNLIPNLAIRGLALVGVTNFLERMGASYMLQCFQAQVRASYWRPAGLGLEQLRKPLTLVDSAKALRQEVESILRKPGSKLLIHIDEHKQMSSVPAFRRGALSVWGEMPELVTVLATDTEPPEPPTKMCRRPVSKPMFDVSSLLWTAGECQPLTTRGPVLKVPTVNNLREKRLLASLRVQLGLTLTQIGLGNLHSKSEEIAAYLAGLQEALDMPEKPGATSAERLVNAILSFPTSIESRGQVPFLVELFLGVPEEDAGQYKFLSVVAMEGFLTAPLEVLLGAAVPKNPSTRLFIKCRDLFLQCLPCVEDLCEGKILERAFLWALACRSEQPTPWKFKEEAGSGIVEFQCRAIASGRVFSGKGALQADLVVNVQQSTLYCAEEGGGVDTHPFADIWLKTESNELVLIYVSGSANNMSCEAKLNRACAMLRRETSQPTFKKLKVAKLRSVVLLPNFDPSPATAKSMQKPGIELVFGQQARRLLGGLSQLLTWLGDDLLD